MNHPEMCYSNDYANNCTIVKWGDGGYYRTDYPTGRYTTDVIDELNAIMGITPEEKRAMVCCSMVAQNNPNLDWEKHYEMCMKGA